jgi:hypothetical protein
MQEAGSSFMFLGIQIDGDVNSGTSRVFTTTNENPFAPVFLLHDPICLAFRLGCTKRVVCTLFTRLLTRDSCEMYTRDSVWPKYQQQLFNIYCSRSFFMIHYGNSITGTKVIIMFMRKIRVYVV